MASEIVATKRKANCELWEAINQLEDVLEIVNEDLLGAPEAETQEQRKALQNRAHNMVRLAQKLASELATATGVR